MTDLAMKLSYSEEPDIGGIVTEDDEPVDNIFSEKQQRLLVKPLYDCWNPGRPFVASAYVGVFYAVNQPPIVPDMFLSMDVRFPDNLMEKKHRSYFLWEYGKPPEIAIEVVSNTEGGEADKKLRIYDRVGVRYYVIFDPQRQIQKDVLRIFELSPEGYIPKIDRQFKKVGLGLTLWDGMFEGTHDRWLRWCDFEGNLIPTGIEQARYERQRAVIAEGETLRERQRAAMAEEKADKERLRAERLAEKLRALGIKDDDET